VTLPPFQTLLDAHWRDVARLAHALAGPLDGDDVAQQAWLQALDGYPRLRSASNLRSWVLTITAHCATDLHRARARRPAPVPDVADVADVAEAVRAVRAVGGVGTVGTAGSVVAAGAADHAAGRGEGPLWDAVRALPERQRTAIALRYVADLDHARVAEALGTTPAATRRLVSDALATLRGSGLDEADELR
jgi:RNA polymerase sigma factor (sigma-70 family)